MSIQYVMSWLVHKAADALAPWKLGVTIVFWKAALQIQFWMVVDPFKGLLELAGQLLHCVLLASEYV